MKVALLTNIVSPHQLPLAEEIVKLIGAENYRYAYTEPFHQERAKMGWDDGSAPEWCKPASECRDFLETADFVYCEERDIDLFERRLKAGKKTFYVSERWFKPILLSCGINLPGWLKLLIPRYRNMAARFAWLFSYTGFRYLSQGPWAKKDMLLITKLLGQRGLDYYSKIYDWGYFVEASHSSAPSLRHFPTIRVLWVGRMIGWKRVDTIVRAVRWIHKKAPNVQVALTLVGNGDKRGGLENLAYGDNEISIIDSMPISEVRNLMRRHDVYVLASNAEEGWGAALNEALEEGMIAFGTYEAGASAAMLPKTHLFHSGDWRALSRLLLKVANGEIGPTGIGGWTAKAAAKRLLELANEEIR